jgi:Ran GTPase-activating protein (RanGAP) involved in mRNA processing and transport
MALPNCCVAGRPEDSALEALRVISEAVAAHGRLEGLNLSDNALGEKGVRAFAAGLSGQVLKFS